jgi:hypothetical protein
MKRLSSTRHERLPNRHACIPVDGIAESVSGRAKAHERLLGRNSLRRKK